MVVHTRRCLLIALLAGMMPALAVVAGSDVPPAVESGRSVSIEFTLTLDDGTVMDSNVGKDPYVFVAGQGQILPALEEALEGAREGETVETRIAPDQAYGPHDPARLREVAADIIPPEGRRAGERLSGRDSQGRPFQIRIVEVRDETVIVDTNHPLAGETLNFTVTILGVE
jgi:FKBP-type peptidyl-prolyl cis-trans isomerase SlyD